MQSVWKGIHHALWMGLVLPILLVPVLTRMVWAAMGETPEFRAAGADGDVTVRLLGAEEEEAELTLEDYLVGVVLGEIPADFEAEALKAQAVAARTYTRKAMATGGKHGKGFLCRDAACCQAYWDPADFLDRGGSRQELETVREAVRDTDDQVLTYNGELIEATFFSCSGGRTEDALAVWGTDYPYLRSIDSPGTAVHFPGRSWRRPWGSHCPGTRIPGWGRPPAPPAAGWISGPSLETSLPVWRSESCWASVPPPLRQRWKETALFSRPGAMAIG